jgi:hypothetical protein
MLLPNAREAGPGHPHLRLPLGGEPLSGASGAVSVGARPATRVGLGQRKIARAANVDPGDRLRGDPILIRGAPNQILLCELFLDRLETAAATQKPFVVPLGGLVIGDWLTALPALGSGAHDLSSSWW